MESLYLKMDAKSDRSSGVKSAKDKEGVLMLHIFSLLFEPAGLQHILVHSSHKHNSHNAAGHASRSHVRKVAFTHRRLDARGLPYFARLFTKHLVRFRHKNIMVMFWKKTGETFVL